MSGTGARELLRKRVRSALERETRINVHRYPIRIHTEDDGAVLLEGEVADIAAKKLALDAAVTAGARGIIDRVRVIPADRRGDGAIRDSLGEFLRTEAELRNCSLRARINEKVTVFRDLPTSAGGAEIQASIADGIIALEGRVISQSHRRFAGVLAWWTPGCRDVVNSLEVDPPAEDRDDDVIDVLRLVLEADPVVDDSEQILPNCKSMVITLDGAVRTEGLRRRIEHDAWCLYGVPRVVNHIQVVA
jgi:osmotically-inducible protein OsmY